MARKLLILAAIISLVLLFQATSGLADNYTLPGGGENARDPVVTWTEVHGEDIYLNSHPGYAGGEFSGSFTSANGDTWKIGDIYSFSDPLVNPVDATPVYNEDKSHFTVTIVYDTLKQPEDGSQRFSVNFSGIPTIVSSDFTLIATAEYSTDKESGIHWKLWNETIYGYGTNDLDNGRSFSISGYLDETQGDSNHYGYITLLDSDGNNTNISGLTLNYDNTSASPTPIPGAVWLLGSGLLGLGGLGLRRRKVS